MPKPTTENNWDTPPIKPQRTADHPKPPYCPIRFTLGWTPPEVSNLMTDIVWERTA